MGRHHDLNAASCKYILPLTIVGAVIGALIAPWLTTRPAAWVRRVINELTVAQLLAASHRPGHRPGNRRARWHSRFPFSPGRFSSILPTIAAIVFGYLGITVMVLRQHEIFALFRRRRAHNEAEAAAHAGAERSARPKEETLLLDTSVIIDGRIADVAHTGFIRSTDARAALRPGRAAVHRRLAGFAAPQPRPPRAGDAQPDAEGLARARSSIIDQDVDGVRQVDAKLVQLARQLNAPIVTNDYNLNRVAGLQGVQVLNINELSNAVKSVVLPGEAMTVRVIQEGKEVNQGIAYLDDGTMVVIENGRRYIDTELDVLVTKVLQTNAGRMIFAAPNR